LIRNQRVVEGLNTITRRGEIECVRLLESVLKEVTDCLERGETVKLSSFGSFVVRRKGQRMGRNPKTNVPVPIVDDSARR
jgi:nucleoid DNA-binding protein